MPGNAGFAMPIPLTETIFLHVYYQQRLNNGMEMELYERKSKDGQQETFPW